MQSIEIIYLCASSVAIFAMIPQIQQLVKVKRSDALSLSTWSTWAVCQVVSLLYSVSIGAIPLFIANVVWVSFYTIMVVLIFRYRTKPIKLEYTPEMEAAVKTLKRHPAFKQMFERDSL